MFLSISTSYRLASVTLFDQHGVILQTLRNNLPNCQSKEIALMTYNILNNINKSSLTNIFVDAGPGSFTGIRTGISLAIGLSVGRAKISGVSSLEAINYSLNRSENTMITIKALPNEYYYQIFNGNNFTSGCACVESEKLEKLANDYNAVIVKDIEVNSEMIGNYGIYLAKNNVYNDIAPIYIKLPNIYTKKLDNRLDNHK